LGAALQADGENEVRGDGLKHQKEKRSMDHFGGLDVSVKETSICIVDDTGRIVKEVKAASEPQALVKVLGNPAYRFKRIGLEAGPLSQWLFNGLAEAGLPPVVCVETRHMQASSNGHKATRLACLKRAHERKWPMTATAQRVAPN
jgi:transposase